MEYIMSCIPRRRSLLVISATLCITLMFIINWSMFSTNHLSSAYSSSQHLSIEDDKDVQIQRIGEFNTFIVYTAADNLFKKVNLFNEVLSQKVETLLNNGKSCFSCVDPCFFRNGEHNVFNLISKSALSRIFYHESFLKFRIVRGYTYNVDVNISFKTTRNASINSSEEITHGPKFVDTESDASVSVYDYFSGGGKGIHTYMLSWQNNKESMQDIYDTQYLSTVLPIKYYYKCANSKRVETLGGWKNLSGSAYASTCMLECDSNYRNTLFKKTSVLPASMLLTDYSRTSFSQSCDIRKLISNQNQTATYEKVLLDMITALDIVSVGGMVTDQGIVYTNQHQVLFHLDCSYKPKKRKMRHKLCPKSEKEVTKTEEVFVLKQSPKAFNHYHFFTEHLTRLSAFVDFLRQRPNIALHVHPNAVKLMQPWLNVYGLANPVVSGAVRANIIYLPHGGACHNAHLPAAQIASSFYHRYIEQNLLASSPNVRPCIVFIKRQSRSIVNFADVYREMEKLSNSKGYELVIFDDSNLPSIEETMRIFYRAKLVIGPHGAGLSNLLFARPGTIVFEVHCIGLSNLRLSFLNLAVKLGMQYYGTVTTRKEATSKRCSDEGVLVDIEEIKNVISYISSNT